jgi:hypothetical protein
MEVLRQRGVKGDRRMEEQVSACQLNNRHPRRERPRHFHSEQPNALDWPVCDPYVGGKRFVPIDGLVESGGGHDWHFSGLSGSSARDWPAAEILSGGLQMGASLYEPINVYKSLAPDVGVVDGPFEYLIVAGVRLPLPFTTRMTVVRLSNGDLFLHSPIKFDEGMAQELRGLGTVRHLVSPNQFHYAHIGEWARAFPDAISWASPGVRQRARARRADIHFTRDLSASVPEEWRGEIDQLLFPGGYFKEFVFFHRASRTLILTDAILNLELDKVSEPWRTAAKLTGMYHPYGQIFFGMRLPLLFQRRATRAAIGKVHEWRPQRILLSHGRYFDSDADEVIRRIFGEPPR